MRREKNFWKGLQEGLLEGSSVVVPCSSLGSPRRGLRPGICPAFSQLPNESMIQTIPLRDQGTGGTIAHTASLLLVTLQDLLDPSTEPK